MDKDKIQTLLEDIFGDALERTKSLLRKYRELYGLPQLDGQWDVDPSFFQHCSRSVNFVVVALYNEKREFLIIYSKSLLGPNQHIGWKLPGGPIQPERKEFVEEAVHRIVKRETNLNIDELQPIAAVKNVFRWNGSQITHNGLAFMGRVSGKLKLRSDHETMLAGTGLERVQTAADTTRPEYKFSDKVPDRMAFSNRDVLLLAKQQLQQKYVTLTPPELPYEEIEASRRWRVRIGKVFHRIVVNRVMQVLASRPVKRRIISYVNYPKSVLDATAGDDNLLCRIADKFSPEVCVANDISWLDMERARDRARRRHLHIVFANHNITDLPFAIRFDVVIFKNTLHHARTKDEVVSFLESLRRVSHRLIIVDVEDPQRSIRAKCFNWYYTKIHGDQGHYFYSRDQFYKLMELAYPDASRHHDAVPTIRGTYMFEIVDFPDTLKPTLNKTETKQQNSESTSGSAPAEV
jgi:ubiquinone/menaquinone biosynthesis C-methylase UbiE/ADP-ribose pyrophosphatase YjhB (NUDIX family)